MVQRLLRFAVMAIVGAAAMIPGAAMAGGKHALLIGNAQYQQGAPDNSWTPLPNPTNDVTLVSQSLKSIGFEVTVVSNGTWQDMTEALDDFTRSLEEPDIVVFYFAGHGFEYGRRNYLVPIDAPLTASEDTIDRTFIEFEDLAGSLLSEGTTIFMLDACRTDGRVEEGRVEEGQPGAATGARGGRGAITRSAPAPVIIAPATRQAVSAGVREFDFEPGARLGVLYSTGRGVPAYDSAPPPKDASPFAAEVAEKILVPRMDISIVFNAIRDGVLKRTEDIWPPQVPFTYNSLSPNTFFTLEPARVQPLDDTPLATIGGGDETPPLAGQSAKGPKPINLTLEELSRIDEPILIMRVLSQHSVADIKALVADGDPLATYVLGYMQEFGLGVPKDLKQARATLEAAAAQGTPYGQLELAYFLRLHPRDDADRARSLELYKAAADQDYAKARGHYSRVLIGAAADSGSPDYIEGVRQQRLAAKGGYAYAYYGLFYSVPEEREAHLADLRAMADQGRSDADAQLCSIFVRERRFAEAVPHCEVSARAGYPDGFAHMALAADKGWAGPRSAEDARFWMRQALSRGDLEAGLCGQMLQMQIELEFETGREGTGRIDACARVDPIETAG